jgi:rhodanese-related sulfurtransferase
MGGDSTSLRIVYDTGECIMSLITRAELKEKLDRKDDFKLVMTLGEWAFRAKHIPGSLSVDTPDSATDILDVGDEIVVYCSHETCAASRYALMALEKAGYGNVRRYAGGIADWEEAGYPLEGEWSDEPSQTNAWPLS